MYKMGSLSFDLEMTMGKLNANNNANNKRTRTKQTRANKRNKRKTKQKRASFCWSRELEHASRHANVVMTSRCFRDCDWSINQSIPDHMEI